MNNQDSYRRRLQAHAKKPTSQHMPNFHSGPRPLDENMKRIIRNQNILKKRIKVVYSPPPPQPIIVGPNILITGGIGDFISIESFLTDIEKLAVRNIYLATRAHEPINSMLNHGSIFPNFEKSTILFDDWSELFCFFNLTHIKDENETKKLKINIDLIPKDIVDYSIFHIFSQIKYGKRKFNSCGLLKNTFADVSRFDLPQEYTFIQHVSPNDRQGGARDFNNHDWEATFRYLSKWNHKGVVVVNSNDAIPQDHRLINLTNPTSYLEALQISKECQGYIGVDSCFAAVATKFLPEDRLKIKSVNRHYLESLEIYCAPYKTFDFVGANIK